MLRLIFVVIIFVHGLIHLLGFVKEWRLAKVPQLTRRTLFPLSGSASKTCGTLWLVACLLFVTSAISFVLDYEWWWIPAATAVLVSQILVVLYWHDAKFGTIANIIVLGACILAYGTWSFNRMVHRELRSFLPVPGRQTTVVGRESVSRLPPVVQKWLERSQVLGKVAVRTVHLRQRGEMRTKPEGKWMPVEAEQYFTVEKPGFLWIADVHLPPFIHLSGLDKYEDGKGYMLISLLSLYPLANAGGRQIDQGALLRYLAETVWFPSAALSSYIRWEAADSSSAIATMSHGSITASGLFRFSGDGDFISFEALRYYDRPEGPTLEPWFISTDPTSYREFDGIRIPTRSTVTWKLKTGDFTWYTLEITAVEYNRVTGAVGD